MSEAERGMLRRLKEAGDKGIISSTVPKTAAALVRELLTAGAVRWIVSGHGKRLLISNDIAFKAITATHYPLGVAELDEGVRDRASAVKLLGDAKRVRSGSREGVFMRSTRPGVMVTANSDGAVIPVSELTSIAGGAALLLDEQRQWSFTGTVAIIENAEAFWRHDCVLDVDLALYAAGRMSTKRLLTWIASPAMQTCQYLHWGDYDPVGASEYLRLRDCCPERVAMYLPASLEELLARHGKRELLAQQANMLHRIRQRSDDPTIAYLIDLWDRHHRGLEQEILLAVNA